MNKSTYWRVLKYSVALTLGSCAILPNRQPVATVEPMFRVSNSPGSAYGYFLLGAYYSGQRRNEKAAEAYRQALQLDPEMVEAHNALAMLHAEGGRYDAAVRHLGIASRLAPQSAKLHNNLGYVYHLQSDYAAAVKEFRSALTLDAHHALATNNLQTSCEKLDLANQEDTAAGDKAEARSLLAFPCAEPHLASKAETGTMDGLIESTLSLLRGRGVPISTPDGQAGNPARAAAVARQSDQSPGFRLEIVNGNGVPGLARRVREALLGTATPAARLSNMKLFTQRDTAIQYRKGFREEARLLSLKLPTRPSPMHLLDLGPAVDVRLILGKDISGPIALALTKYSASERMASATAYRNEAISGGSDVSAPTRD